LGIQAAKTQMTIFQRLVGYVMCNIAIALPQWIKSTHVILINFTAVKIAIVFLGITIIFQCWY